LHKCISVGANCNSPEISKKQNSVVILLRQRGGINGNDFAFLRQKDFFAARSILRSGEAQGSAV
jgi:hypothetical protein